MCYAIYGALILLSYLYCDALLGDYALVTSVGDAQWVQVSRGDFLQLDPCTLTGEPGLVVINPPYGRRLGTPAASSRLFQQILTRLRDHYPGWRCALIAPERKLAEALPFPLRVFPLQHGGLHLPLLVGRVP